MKRVIKIILIVAAAVLVVIQFFGIDRTAEAVVPNETLQAAVAVPADITQILGRSCNDCHSNQTTYPWYASVQPAGWFLAGHIEDGRRELNFSKFNTYAPTKKKRKLEEICDEVKSGSMPLPSYLWIHRDAVISQSDAAALCDWAGRAAEQFGTGSTAEQPGT
jgi:hypothetical protein